MNSIFPERSYKPPVRRFEFPMDTLRLYRKRSREMGCEKAIQTSRTPDPSKVAFIRKCIEYGDNGTINTQDNLHTAGDSNDRTHRMASLQSALSILCHIAAKDETRYFTSNELIRPPKGSNKVSSGSSSSTVTGNSGSVNSNSSGVNKKNLSPAFSLTDVYTTVCALKLEYEDVLQQQKNGSGKHNFDPQLAANTLKLTESRVDASLSLFESTVLQMVVNLDRAPQLPVTYIGGVLKALPQMFDVEKWPCTILQKEDNKKSQLKHPLSGMDECKHVSNAATSIVLNTLREIKSMDCTRVLDTLKMKTTTCKTNVSTLMSYEEMMLRATNGVYRSRGLYSALHDMKLLFYELYCAVRPEHKVAVNSLHLQFEQSLRRNYGIFLRKIGLVDEATKDLLVERTMFDVNPLPTNDESTSYSETQRRCLKLLPILREVDTNHYFEYPVFDMANIDLRSIELWLHSPSFGIKTNRDAFIALRDVLEHMVDNCVLTHGPTSPFTVVITRVRQRLVDAARTVGIL
ncbi:uncharacterized protein TM35_000014990 [Trypanosoma theileri]|uniref:Uncharacterized protein n=1 Tax=Trypanosoma theileri TaxID=67003 RepID=A0A1X0P9M0_9TRYP|nr:uncharacterized protein TM35_000014990 [Trypanosoma theileri]ORC93622.1 hypothetical protein TM35_000014990 [Trypanosoma theileri]